jgi:hypothetical protein
MESDQDDLPRWETAFSEARRTPVAEVRASPDDEPWARDLSGDAPPPAAYVEAYLESFGDRRHGRRGARSR